ncbi:hypothetical protein PR048_001976 [Dryococelus australis]|uniref:Uncharacterized protein n=1 Tax=Dryococelus australis TaxID=614101 RepID=A0ABQ9IJL1_9NEOP|nr:hypothetical protein PR048_001976 [Dryococelus australis]
MKPIDDACLPQHKLLMLGGSNGRNVKKMERLISEDLISYRGKPQLEKIKEHDESDVFKPENLLHHLQDVGRRLKQSCQNYVKETVYSLLTLLRNFLLKLANMSCQSLHCNQGQFLNIVSVFSLRRELQNKAIEKYSCTESHIDDYWNYFFELKNSMGETRLPTVAILVKAALALSHGSGDVQQGRRKKREKGQTDSLKKPTDSGQQEFDRSRTCASKAAGGAQFEEGRRKCSEGTLRQLQNTCVIIGKIIKHAGKYNSQLR